ncbi:hypothetical protein [Haloglomus litoreum]|uniref:hypothetical protein n=1 Tax=Haloglomus litoreum TaxID=3034026 RepID=UPI0023E78E06|nr:hypothetical protein [Haloglomus sp. DT116]
MSPDTETTAKSTDDRRLRYGALSVAGGAASMVLLWYLPGDLLLAEVVTALLALVLLVTGTLAVGTSVSHRAA